MSIKQKKLICPYFQFIKGNLDKTFMHTLSPFCFLCGLNRSASGKHSIFFISSLTWYVQWSLAWCCLSSVGVGGGVMLWACTAFNIADLSKAIAQGADGRSIFLGFSLSKFTENGIQFAYIYVLFILAIKSFRWTTCEKFFCWLSGSLGQSN